MKNQIKTLTTIVALFILATSCQKEALKSHTALSFPPISNNEMSTKINAVTASSITRDLDFNSNSILEAMLQFEEVERTIQEILEAKKESGEIMEEFYELETPVQVAMTIIKLKDLGFQIESIRHEDLEYLVVDALETFEVNYIYFNTPLTHVKEYVMKTQHSIVQGFFEDDVPELVRDNIILLGEQFVQEKGEALAKARLYLLNQGESIAEESRSIPFYIDVLILLQADF